MKSIHTLFCVCLFAFGIVSSVQAEPVGSWSVNKTDASDPLLFSHAGKTLHMLKNLGPVFATTDGQIGPQDYKTQVTAVEEQNGKVILKCRAPTMI